jgi:hypothetical protein
MKMALEGCLGQTPSTWQGLVNATARGSRVQAESICSSAGRPGLRLALTDPQTVATTAANRPEHRCEPPGSALGWVLTLTGTVSK